MSKNFEFILSICRKYKKVIFFWEYRWKTNQSFSISIFLCVNEIELQREKESRNSIDN